MADLPSDDVVRSFYRMRQALGYLGLLLPVILILGGVLSMGIVEPSISDYYHTILRDIYVGTLTAIGMFLICYRGHSPEGAERLSDDAVTTLAGVSALGVAFLPNANRGPGDPAGLASISQEVFGPEAAAIGHYVCAIVFLSCLAWLSLVRFSKTTDRARRRLYRASGWGIVVMTAATIAASWFKIMGPPGPQRVVNETMLVLWFEAAAVWAFALSWLAKGRADRGLARMVRKAAAAGGGRLAD